MDRWDMVQWRMIEEVRGGDGRANDDDKIGLRSGQARKRHLEDVERLATPIEVDRSTSSATKKKIGGRMQIVGRKID